MIRHIKKTFRKVWTNKDIKNIKSENAQGLDEIAVKIWKIQKFQNLLINYLNKAYYQEDIEVWGGGCIIPVQKRRYQ